MSESAWLPAAVVLGIALPLRLRSMFHRRALERGRRRHTWTAAAMFLSILVLYAGTAAHLAVAGWDGSWGLLVAGAAAYGAGLWVRARAIRTLGAYFSPHIEIRDRQPLIEAGPFRYLRHPNYAGLLLEAAGLPLMFQAGPVLLFAAVAFVPVVLLRIHFEERELVGKFGEAYLDYRRRVGALFPFRSKAPLSGGVS
jgi:protein-S-isoprenylcysteine O-methyltransferase Ste14